MNELIIEVNSKNKTGFGFRAYAETYDQMEIMDKIKTALKGGQVDLLVKPQITKIIDKAIKNEETAIEMNRLTNNMRGTVNYCLVRLNAIKTELSNLSL